MPGDTMAICNKKQTVTLAKYAFPERREQVGSWCGSDKVPHPPPPPSVKEVQISGFWVLMGGNCPKQKWGKVSVSECPVGPQLPPPPPLKMFGKIKIRLKLVQPGAFFSGGSIIEQVMDKTRILTYNCSCFQYKNDHCWLYMQNHHHEPIEITNSIHNSHHSITGKCTVHILLQHWSFCAVTPHPIFLLHS